MRQADVGAVGGPVAVDLQLIHREREDDVALAQIVEAPAAEQVREVIDDDEVGVEPRRLALLDERLPGQDADRSLDPVLARDRPTCETAWKQRAVEEPLLVVDRVGGELAGRERLRATSRRPAAESGVATSKIAIASKTGRRASVLPSGPRLKMPTQKRSSPLDGARRPRSSR